MSKLSDFLAKNGSFPGISLMIRPIDNSRKPVEFNTYLSYSFQSSIVIPVDTFTVSFKNPGFNGSFTDFVMDGDIAIFKANDVPISTCIIDVVDISTTNEGGEVVTLHGRDLLGQLEDQNAVNDQSAPIYVSQTTVVNGVLLLKSGTRIPGVVGQDAPRNKYLLASEPGESKLSSLQRFLEPLNCVAWSMPDGRTKVGRPNMAQSTPALGTLVLDSVKRVSNVLQMKAVYASTQIPNLVIPIWSGQEEVVSRVAKQQGLANPASGPARLRKFGHFVTRSVVASTPMGADAQALAANNDYVVAAQGGGNLLQAHAKREIARSNVGELMVQAIVAGHYNDDLKPFVIDTMYQIYYPRAGVSQKMYLYQVEYSGDISQGQRTSLMFCKLGTIVSDIRAK